MANNCYVSKLCPDTETSCVWKFVDFKKKINSIILPGANESKSGLVLKSPTYGVNNAFSFHINIDKLVKYMPEREDGEQVSVEYCTPYNPTKLCFKDDDHDGYLNVESSFNVSLEVNKVNESNVMYAATISVTAGDRKMIGKIGTHDMGHYINLSRSEALLYINRREVFIASPKLQDADSKYDARIIDSTRYDEQPDHFWNPNFYILPGEDTISMEVTIYQPGNIVSEPLELVDQIDSTSELVCNMETMFKDAKEHFSDLVLVCEEEEIHCHKSVLAARCPFFKGMFENSDEANRGKVTLAQVSLSTLRAVLQFIYTGKFKAKSVNEIFEVLNVAKEYLLFRLVDMCAIELENNREEFSRALTADNAYDRLKLAELHSLDGLKKVLLNHIVCNKRYFMHNETFLEKIRQDPELFTELMRMI